MYSFNLRWFEDFEVQEEKRKKKGEWERERERKAN